MDSKFKGEYSGTKIVSERHEIDQKKLQEYLSDKLTNFEEINSIEEFVGGQSNPTYLLKTQSESYVLRRKPPGKLLKSAHAGKVKKSVMIFTGVAYTLTVLVCLHS